MMKREEQRQRKARVLTQGTPTMTNSIADAIVVKNENLFFLTTPAGEVPLKENHGLGLYYHDCRYLGGYTLRLADAGPVVLTADESQRFRAVFEFTNPEIQAAMQFNEFRLPELFAGFSRHDYSVPVRYPVACHPQAWAAGAVLYLVEMWLGLQPDAFARRLRIVRPMLPDSVDRLEVKRLRVGEARVDLSFERAPNGTIACEVLKVNGALDVVVEARSARRDEITSVTQQMLLLRE